MYLCPSEFFLAKMSGSQGTKLVSLDLTSSIDWCKRSLQSRPHLMPGQEKIQSPGVTFHRQERRSPPRPPAAWPSQCLTCLLPGPPDGNVLKRRMDARAAQIHRHYPSGCLPVRQEVEVATLAKSRASLGRSVGKANAGNPTGMK